LFAQPAVLFSNSVYRHYFGPLAEQKLSDSSQDERWALPINYQVQRLWPLFIRQ